MDDNKNFEAYKSKSWYLKTGKTEAILIFTAPVSVAWIGDHFRKWQFAPLFEKDEEKGRRKVENRIKNGDRVRPQTRNLKQFKDSAASANPRGVEDFDFGMSDNLKQKTSWMS